jgi:hypothetical protein
MFQIDKIEKDISDLKIKWSDGEESGAREIIQAIMI